MKQINSTNTSHSIEIHSKAIITLEQNRKDCSFSAVIEHMFWVDNSTETNYHTVEYQGHINGLTLILNGGAGALIRQDVIEWDIGRDPSFFDRGERYDSNYDSTDIVRWYQNSTLMINFPVQYDEIIASNGGRILVARAETVNFFPRPRNFLDTALSSSNETVTLNQLMFYTIELSSFDETQRMLESVCEKVKLAREANSDNPENNTLGCFENEKIKETGDINFHDTIEVEHIAMAMEVFTDHKNHDHVNIFVGGVMHETLQGYVPASIFKPTTFLVGFEWQPSTNILSQRYFLRDIDRRFPRWNRNEQQIKPFGNPSSGSGIDWGDVRSIKLAKDCALMLEWKHGYLATRMTPCLYIVGYSAEMQGAYIKKLNMHNGRTESVCFNFFV